MKKLPQEMRRRVIREFYGKKLHQGRALIEIANKEFWVDARAQIISIGMGTTAEEKRMKTNLRLLSVFTGNGIFMFNVSHWILMQLKKSLYYYEQVHVKKNFKLLYADIKPRDLQLTWKGEKKNPTKNGST